ncbi:MAG: hypothetical protein MI924_03630 [Chloroflexales bacterium]|nr:hypothetical protein [Chloroflexales bacterium]
MNRTRRDESLDVVHHLMVGIGPRSATSLAEAQAAAYIDGRLRRAGMRVSAEAFTAPASFGWTYPLLAILSGLIALLSVWLPLLSLLLALLGLALVLSDGALISLPSLASHGESQNVVGTRASEKEERWRVVLLAPLDSPLQQGWFARFRGARRAAIIGRIIAFTLLALLSGLQLLDPQHPFWLYSHALPVMYLLLTQIPGAFRTKAAAKAEMPGGAGALAAMLAAVERLGTLRQVQVWAVALGATATGNSGLRNFLERYPFPQDTTLFIALEMIAQGQLTYISREGVLLRQYSADPLLMQLAADADASDTRIDAEPRSYHAAPTLATLLHAEGYRPLTLMTSATFTKPVSRDSDTTAVDQQTIERAARLFTAIVKRLDEEGGSGNGM